MAYSIFALRRNVDRRDTTRGLVIVAESSAKAREIAERETQWEDNPSWADCTIELLGPAFSNIERVVMRDFLNG